MNLEEIRDSFAFFDDWEDKYRFIIDLGKGLPELPEADRSEENLVRGCQSQVWLRGGFDPATNTLELAIDSDAHIVRGLISVVLAAYEGLSPAQVRDHDTEGLFEELELLEHLSPTRGNGLRAMVNRVKQLAQEHCQ